MRRYRFHTALLAHGKIKDRTETDKILFCLVIEIWLSGFRDLFEIHVIRYFQQFKVNLFQVEGF